MVISVPNLCLGRNLILVGNGVVAKMQKGPSEAHVRHLLRLCSFCLSSSSPARVDERRPAAASPRKEKKTSLTRSGPWSALPRRWKGKNDGGTTAKERGSPASSK
jgi:hypothetical protein